MKRITMSLDEYLEDLRTERLKGAKITPEIINKLNTAFVHWHSNDGAEWQSAMRELSIMLNDLKHLDFKEE